MIPKYYEVVSITEKPYKIDYYFVQDKEALIGKLCYWTGQEWRWYKNIPDKATGFTHYLKLLTSLPIDRKAAAKIATDAWNAGIEQVLKDIATTFSLPANQQKADKQSDRDVFKAIGDTIQNFPKPKATEYLKQFP